MFEQCCGRKQQVGTRSISHARLFSHEEYCCPNASTGAVMKK